MKVVLEKNLIPGKVYRLQKKEDCGYSIKYKFIEYGYDLFGDWRTIVYNYVRKDFEYFFPRDDDIWYYYPEDQTFKFGK